MNGYLIALIVLLVYLVLVYLLKTAKWFEKHNMSLTGPIIMWRTQRGRDLIDRIARRKRIWNFYGRVALWICMFSMIAIMALLLWEATIVPQVKKAPSPELILGLPGINPIIPLGYGILALVVAIVVHEFAHGIMTRVGGMKVRSLGLVFLVVPIGAFVEPDDKELESTTRSKRSKVFAAGPATNIVVAGIMLLLFSSVFMASAQPTHEGALATGVVDGSPAAHAGIKANSVIVRVGQTIVTGADGITAPATPDRSPGKLVEVDYYYKGNLRSTNLTEGVVVAYTARDFAAANAGLKAGMVLVSLNDTPLFNITTLEDVMASNHAWQTVNLTAMEYSAVTGGFVVNSSITTVTLSNKYDYYATYDPHANKLSYKGVAYLGAGFLMMGVDVENASFYAEVLAHPFKGDKSWGDYSKSALRLIALPFLNLAPLRSPVTDLYHPGGALAWMPSTPFYLLANSFYWIFWLNLMVGLTNVLPAVPLDGGYIFRDFIDYLLSKTGREYTKAQRDKVVGAVVTSLALLVLGLIVWQIVGPAL